MAYPVPKDYILDWFVKFCDAYYPQLGIQHRSLDTAINISPDGKIQRVDPGKINLTGIESALVAASISILTGLINQGIEASAKHVWQEWRQKKDSEKLLEILILLDIPKDSEKEQLAQKIVGFVNNDDKKLDDLARMLGVDRSSPPQ